MNAALDPANILVRPLSVNDAAEAAELSGQLGYSVSATELQLRIEAIARSADRVAYAALMNAHFVGWIDASVERHLQSPDSVVIGGLVVRDTVRGCGIGKRLCSEIEDWARSRRISVLRVRSQAIREDAHRFYLRDGYRKIKISVVFEKIVD